VAPPGWYARLVIGFVNYSRWPMARKWLLVTGISVIFQIQFNLLVMLLDIDAGRFDGATYLRFGWAWVAYSLLSIGICAAIHRRGPWTEWVGMLAMLGYLSFVLVATELLGGSAGSYALAPTCIVLIAIVVFGPRAGAIASAYVFLGMLLLNVAHLRDWLPLAPLLGSDSVPAGNDVGWYLLLDVLAAQFLVMMVALCALIFSARDYAEAALQRNQQLIRRYLPRALADQIIAGRELDVIKPQRRRVTVLFSDIVGFTDLADRVEPEVLTQVINEYMAAMSEIVDDHQGTVNEFIGDGLMALFGAPEPLEPEVQARQAIRAAQAMQARLPELNPHWRKLGLGTALQIRIGINTGMASVGSYGSEGRMTYTAIGLQTNIAARIQAHCEPGGILISEATYHLVEGDIDCAPKGEIECKGVHFPIRTYAPASGARMGAAAATSA
jgi:class 3 adenylate cyclase